MKRLLHSSWLDSHFNLEARAGKVEGLSLERAKRLADLIGNPQKAYPSIHITGTNGKSSTAHILTRLLMAAGLKVGTYSSPHIKNLNERFKVNDEAISDEDLDEILGVLKGVEDSSGETFSWFELSTGAGFLWFQKNNVDVSVIEVGKLGRYDATNIIDAQTAIVTNISKDHTDGIETRQEWETAIAQEKAGIVKKGSALILGNISPNLKEIFLAEEPGEVFSWESDFYCDTNKKAEGGRKLDISCFINDSENEVTPKKYTDLFLSMHGAHQGRNAALALMAAEVFLKNSRLPNSLDPPGSLDEKKVASAFSGASLPGRYEIVSKDPLIIIDGGHNPEGAAAASLTLKDFLEDFLAGKSQLFENSTLIFGITREKETAEMLEALDAGAFSRIICTSIPNQRGRDAFELANTAKEIGFKALAEPDPEKAVSLAMDSDLIFVCGSLYLAGAVYPFHYG